VNFSRPSIDVLFETGALAFKKEAIGVLLTGASRDGTYGMGMIHSLGGMTVVQDPDTAYVASMPQSAIQSTPIDYVLPLNDIGPFLNTLSRAQVRK
jgi:two-component system chemotaxis response regulator CheB